MIAASIVLTWGTITTASVFALSAFGRAAVAHDAEADMATLAIDGELPYALRHDIATYPSQPVDSR